MPLKIIPDPNKPLPDDFDPEEPTSFNKKVKIAAATAKVLLEGGAEINQEPDSQKNAEEIFKAFTSQEPSETSTTSMTKFLNQPATVRHLFAMLSDYDHQVVDEAVQLRRFVTNKLIEDAGHTDARHRLKALELLGKISDVGLFADKTEITVKHTNIEDLENGVRSKLFKILGQSIAVDASFEVLDAELSDETPKE